MIPRKVQKVQIYELEKIKRNQKRILRSCQSKRESVGDCAVLGNKIKIFTEEGKNTRLK